MITSPITKLFSTLNNPSGNDFQSDFASRIITAPQVEKIHKALPSRIPFQTVLQTIVDFNSLTCLEQSYDHINRDSRVCEISLNPQGIIIVTIGGLDEDALFLRLDSDTSIVIQEVTL
jgi:WD40 repeat protein